MAGRIFTSLTVITVSGLLLWSCDSDDEKDTLPSLNFRSEMRQFVQEISTYSKSKKSNFSIIPQNGQELLADNSEASGSPVLSYINAIDAVGREDLFYGYEDDDQATPAEDNEYMISFCDIAKQFGKPVLTTDYCFTHSKMDDSYAKNEEKGYASFAADHRELDNIPQYPVSVHNVNASDVTVISQAKNFLYLINPSAFATKQEFLDAVRETNYDLVLIDLFFNDETLTATDVSSLKTKANGGSRIVIAYMSIGEAEDYRYYWNDLDKSLIYESNPDWPGNYAVKYWEPKWKSVIYGNDNSYTKKLIDAGFDGAYLDIIEAYEYFE
jgi:cysteinyl-tRNA synthetase, unknown class